MKHRNKILKILNQNLSKEVKMDKWFKSMTKYNMKKYNLEKTWLSNRLLGVLDWLKMVNI
jgi:hypothetical protein